MDHNYSHVVCEAITATAIGMSLDLALAQSLSASIMSFSHPVSMVLRVDDRRCEIKNRFTICNWVHTSSSEAANTQHRRPRPDMRYQSSDRMKRVNEDKEWN